jgi:hypothetical protein
VAHCKQVLWINVTRYLLKSQSLNGVAGLAPGLVMTGTVFASSVGAYVGSALGEYARAKGVKPSEAVYDLKASVTAAAAATEKPCSGTALRTWSAARN